MAEPFTFRWGPGRLAGMGIHLTPDQASCTETTGKALILAPLHEPCMGCGDMHQQIYDPKTDRGVVKPLIVDVVLNELVTETHGPKTVTYLRQDVMDDYHHGPKWRTYAQVVSNNADSYDPWDVWMYEETDIPTPAWSAVMIDSDQAQRINRAHDRAMGATDHQLLGLFEEIASEGIDNICECDSEGYDESGKCPRWSAIAEDLGISDALDDYGRPVEYPDYLPERLIPVYDDAMDADILKIWRELVSKSAMDWETYDKITKRRTDNQYYYNPSDNPFG